MADPRGHDVCAVLDSDVSHGLSLAAACERDTQHALGCKAVAALQGCCISVWEPTSEPLDLILVAWSTLLAWTPTLECAIPARLAWSTLLVLFKVKLLYNLDFKP